MGLVQCRRPRPVNAGVRHLWLYWTTNSWNGILRPEVKQYGWNYRLNKTKPYPIPNI